MVSLFLLFQKFKRGCIFTIRISSDEDYLLYFGREKGEKGDEANKMVGEIFYS